MSIKRPAAYHSLIVATFSVDSQLGKCQKSLQLCFCLHGLNALNAFAWVEGMNAFGYPMAEEEYFDEENIALSASTSLEVFSRLDFVPCENARIPGKK